MSAEASMTHKSYEEIWKRVVNELAMRGSFSIQEIREWSQVPEDKFREILADIIYRLEQGIGKDKTSAWN
jgi:hypothetical protein